MANNVHDQSSGHKKNKMKIFRFFSEQFRDTDPGNNVVAAQLQKKERLFDIYVLHFIT